MAAIRGICIYLYIYMFTCVYIYIWQQFVVDGSTLILPAAGIVPAWLADGDFQVQVPVYIYAYAYIHIHIIQKHGRDGIFLVRLCLLSRLEQLKRSPLNDCRSKMCTHTYIYMYMYTHTYIYTYFKNMGMMEYILYASVCCFARNNCSGAVVERLNGYHSKG